MSKKFIALLLVLAIALVGCGGSASSAAPAPASSAAPASSEAPASSAEPEPVKVDYPTKTVEVVYHSGVGSGGDVMIRAMDQALIDAAAKGRTKHVGWVVNNMQGGAGAIGSIPAMRSPTATRCSAFPPRSSPLRCSTTWMSTTRTLSPSR